VSDEKVRGSGEGAMLSCRGIEALICYFISTPFFFHNKSISGRYNPEKAIEVYSTNSTMNRIQIAKYAALLPLPLTFFNPQWFSVQGTFIDLLLRLLSISFSLSPPPPYLCLPHRLYEFIISFSIPIASLSFTLFP
jgi:hypothetical protein